MGVTSLDMMRSSPYSPTARVLLVHEVVEKHCCADATRQSGFCVLAGGSLCGARAQRRAGFSRARQSSQREG